MSARLRKLLPVFLFFAIAGGYTLYTGATGSCPFAGGGSPSPELVGRQPQWQALSLTGEQVTSASLTGQPTVLALWASWCPHCRRELTDLAELRKEEGDRLAVVTMTVDEVPARAQAHLEQAKLDLPLLVANPGALEALGQPRSVPLTVVFDAEGRVVEVFEGRVSLSALRQAVETAGSVRSL